MATTDQAGVASPRIAEIADTARHDADEGGHEGTQDAHGTHAAQAAPDDVTPPVVAVAPPVGAPVAKPRRAPRAPSSPSHRILEQPGFVLHSYPYRETSLIVDVLTRDHGRISLVAKGAKRPHSALRGVLQTFQPLSLGWSGRAEMRTLTRAEWVGGMLPLAGDALVCGFYVNELLVRFCAREDPHPALFRHYAITLARLAHDEPAALVLRSFERMLLRETGYAVAFSVDLQRDPPRPDAWYVFDPERGARLAYDNDPHAWPRILGQTLIDMEADDYQTPRTVSQSKTLMRFLLNYHLGGTPLNTRQILIDLQKL